MPLKQAVEYVAAAYIVVFVIVAVYLSIMSTRLRRVERGLSELLSEAGDQLAQPPAPHDPPSASAPELDGEERTEASASASRSGVA